MADWPLPPEPVLPTVDRFSMSELESSPYRCPATLSALAPGKDGDRIEVLRNDEGHTYAVEDGIPNLTHPRELLERVAATAAAYNQMAGLAYEAAMEWQFAAAREDEETVREKMVDLLHLMPGQRVLEIGCGSGRDSFRIGRRLGGSGSLFLQDLSRNMILCCREKLTTEAAEGKTACDLRFHVSNASYLPFEDGFFDAVFHFGGFNEFGDQRRAANEMARVTKLGGRVVFGDETVAPWLRGTEFEKIVVNNNPLFKNRAPIRMIPHCAREVAIRWIIGGCFYLIDYSKGEGLPDWDLDLPHRGRRGGTLRTRYFGNLEGVTLETKQKALEAAARSGQSMHEWLDAVVRREAENQLGDSAE